MKTILFHITLFSSVVLVVNSMILTKSSISSIDKHNQSIHIIDNKTLAEFQSATEIYLHNYSVQEIKEDALLLLPNLKKLSLLENNLTSLKGLGNLPLLTELILRKNSISFIKEGDIINLGSLRILDLSENNLTEIYSDFFNFLPSLINLSVSRNKLSEIPESLKNISLSTLDASYNNLTDIDIKNVTDYINLSHNFITDILFADTVVIIKISHNELTNLWSAVDELYNLTYADFSHNKIEYFWLNHLHSIKELNLSSNSISVINGGGFNSQEKLKNLDLSNNEITDLEYGSFTGLNELFSLDLSGNNISEWNTLYTLDTVAILNLQGNLLENLNPKLVVEYLKKLEIIGINFNSISCEKLVWYLQIFTEHKIVVKFGSDHNTSNVHGMKCDHTKSFFNLTTINEIRILHVMNYIGEMYTLLIVVLVVCILALIVKMLKLYKVIVIYFKESKSAQELHSCSLKLLSETDSVD